MLLVLTAADARGVWLLFAVFAIQALVAVWLLRALSAAVVPVVTALVWAPIGLALAEADSEWTLPLAIGICLLASLPGVLIALLGVFAVGERPEKQVPSPPTTLVAVIAAGLAVGGCGGDSTERAGPGTDAKTASVPVQDATAPIRTGTTTGAPASTTSRDKPAAPAAAPAAPSPAASAQPSSSAAEQLRERIPGDRRPPARTLPNGAVVIPPPAPTATAQPASDACHRAKVDRDGAPTTVEVPPAPGLRAQAVDDAVRVTVDTGQPPARCAPNFVSVRVQLGTDLRSPVSRDVRLRRLGEHTVTIRLPDTHPPVADGVVRATAGTDTGRISRTTSIALR